MKHSFDLATKPLDSMLFAKENPNCSLYVEENQLWVSGDLTKEQAKALLDAHNPPDPIIKENEAKAAKEAAQAKLAALGLTTDDLKALGL